MMASLLALNPMRRMVTAGFIVIYFYVASFNLQSQLLYQSSTNTVSRNLNNNIIDNYSNISFHDIGKAPRCAINFYGLPRAFESLVLPSIIQNVIIPNAKYGCDYHVHYYDQQSEQAGRSGSGGTIIPDEILSLREQVELVSEDQQDFIRDRRPTVVFVKDTEEEFWKQRGPVLQRIRTTKDADGNYVYFPWKAKSYTYPTSTDNIIKMWHSIQSAWDLMEKSSQQQGFKYDRVAMMRSDVVYVTPIDIFDKGDGTIDTENKYAVVPAFCRFPVSDRLVYGPYQAIKVWSSQRFSRMEKHVRWAQQNDPGHALHSEHFVSNALFPAMREGVGQLGGGIEIVEHPTMCFFRARSDESVWIGDCAFGGPKGSAPSIQENLGRSSRAVVEKILNRKCWKRHRVENLLMMFLDCSRFKGNESAPVLEI